MMVSSAHSILDGHEREDVEDWARGSVKRLVVSVDASA
jgi:hypothetical protein